MWIFDKLFRHVRVLGLVHIGQLTSTWKSHVANFLKNAHKTSISYHSHVWNAHAMPLVHTSVQK